MMQILFPALPDRNEIDSCFAAEAEAAKWAGFKVGLVDTSLLFGEEVRLRHVLHGWHCLYRGWILKPEAYLALENAVGHQGAHLVVRSQAYCYAQRLPSWYNDLSSLTPMSLAIDEAEVDHLGVQAVAARIGHEFGPGPVIVKDYLKSRKHEWHDACFIRDASCLEDTARVVSNFIDRQRSDGTFVGGLVTRQFVPLRHVGIHPKSRMPLTNEWRGFLWGTQVIQLCPYWGNGADYSDMPQPPKRIFEAVAEAVKQQSSFISVDVAEQEDGNWVVIEIGDGGTSGIPEGTHPRALYQALHSASI